MATGVDNVDMSFKHILGRLGFDKSLPWYEENQQTPELIAHESLMTESVPTSVPSLVRGGKVNIQLNERGFDSNGKETTNKPVVTARIRTPLISVKKYGDDEKGYYVFINEQLKSSCKKFGYVVEVLKEENTIEVTDNNFYILNNHVCFTDSNWSDDDSLFVSFYEYTGSRGIIPVVREINDTNNMTTSGDETTELLVTKKYISDEIEEGIINVFYTESRFLNSFQNMTTDDLPKGELTKEHDLSVRKSIEESFESIPKYLHQLSVSQISQHFNKDTFSAFFDQILSKTSSDELIEGSNNKYLSKKSFLDLISDNDFLETNLIKESQDSLYFTSERAKKVFDEAILSLDVKNVKNAVSEDRHESLQLSVQFITEHILSINTDNIPEGSNLYYNESRVNNHPSFISVSNLLNSITYEYITSPLPHDSLPVTHSSLTPLLENWLSEKTLQDINDGDTRRLISEQEMKEGWVMLENKIPVSTDDLSEGESKFFSEHAVTEILKNTSVDLLLPGGTSFTPEKAASEAQKLINDLTLDDVKNGTIYRKLSTGDVHDIIHDIIQPLKGKDDQFHERFELIDSNLTLKDEKIENNNNRLTDVESKLPILSENLVSVNSILNTLDTDSLPEGGNIYFTDERAHAAIANVLTTSEVVESDSHLYFSSERCLSVCQSSFVSVFQLSMSESNAQSNLNNEIHPLSLQVDKTYQELNALKESFHEHQSTTSDSVRELFDVISVSSSNVDSHILSVSKQYEQNNERSSLLILSLAGGLEELSTSNATLHDSINIINHTTSSFQDLLNDNQTRCTALELWRNDTDAWKNTLKIDANDVIESDTRLFFTEERSLSVNKTLYDRVGSIERNFTALQTSSATLSDDRLKSQEVPITGGLPVITALAPLSYKMVLSLGAPESEAFDDVGFIAQDVAQIDELSHAVVQGSDTTPFSLDYHSITTFTVAAVQELTLSVSTIANRSTDDIQEGSSNKFLTTENLKTALGFVTTDDLSQGVMNKYKDEFVGLNLKLEEFKLLLQQIDTDSIPQGSINLYDQVSKILTTDDVPEAGSLYFTTERCEAVMNSVVNSLNVDDISETESKGFLTLTRLLHELKFVTADHIGNGISNRFLNLETFLDLGITTYAIPEGDSNLYLTQGRVRESAQGMSIDEFIDGNTNLFCTRHAVNIRMNSLDTNSLPEAPGKRYVSRDAYFELNISVGDVLSHETLARRDEVEQSLSLTSLFHTEQLETAISISDLKLSLASHELNTKIDSVDAVFTNSLSVSHNILSSNINQTNIDLHKTDLNLSVSNIKITSNESNIENLYSLVSVNNSNIENHDQLINENNQSINTNSINIQLNNTEISKVNESLNNSILSVSQTTNTYILSVSQTSNTQILSVSQTTNTHILSVSGVIDAGLLSLSSEISTVATGVSALTTDDISESNTRKYVSARSMLDMAISTDSITQGETNKYTTLQSVKDVLANLTTADLPESELNPYVSKSNIIATQLKPNELNEFSESIDDHLGSITSDKLPEGTTNLYFTDQRVQQVLQGVTTNDIQEGQDNKYFSDARVLHALSTASTDNIVEGQNKYFTDERVAAVIASSSSSDIKEGSNLYFTSDRVIHTLSIATTDSVPEGTSNKYLSRNNVLSIGFDVTDFIDSSNSLLTKDSFLSQVSAHLTTDEITEGNNKFVSSDSVLQIMNGFTTDQLSEGSNLYFTEDRVNQIIIDSFGQNFDSRLQTKSTDDIPEGNTNLYFTEDILSQTLKSSHVIDTGITPEDIGARPNNLSIHSSEIVEDQSALFFTPGRFNIEFNEKNTDDLQEGNNKYFTSEKVIQSIQNIGNLSVSLNSNSPGELEVQISISNDQVLGGEIELKLENTTYKIFNFNGTVISDVITNLNPGALVVDTIFKSRYGVKYDNQTIIISGNTPTIEDISFIEEHPGYTNQVKITLGGHGMCDISISSNDYIIKNDNLNLFDTNEFTFDLNCIFDSATFVVKQKNVVVDSSVKNMTLGLVLPMKKNFSILTNSIFNALDTIPFDGIGITIDDDSRILNGNLFHSIDSPDGTILSAAQTQILYGTSSGLLKVQLTHPNTPMFVSFT
jgi:hypothetical protein